MLLSISRFNDVFHCPISIHFSGSSRGKANSVFYVVKISKLAVNIVLGPIGLFLLNVHQFRTIHDSLK